MPIAQRLPDAMQRRRRVQPRVRHLNHASLAAAHVAFPSAIVPVDEPPKWMTRLPGRGLPLTTKIGNHFTRIICLLSLGHSSLSRVWEMTKPGHDDAWHSFRDGLAYRTSNMNIVAGLILASTAVFLSTSPPSPDVLQYTATAPYIFLLASFCMALIAIGSGSFLLFILSEAEAASFRTLVRSPVRLWFTLYMIGSPSLWVGSSGITAIVGLSWSAWVSNNFFSKAGVTLAIATVIFQCATFVLLAV